MTAWGERPREEANLLNPAFCCLGITAAALGYQQEVRQDLPFPLTYMVLPIVLHKETRDELPISLRTSLPLWIQEHASARVLFFERLVALQPHTREAVLFGCQYGHLRLAANAAIHAEVTAASLQRTVQLLHEEPRGPVSKAHFVGKWFAAAGPAPTVMALWGIQL